MYETVASHSNPLAIMNELRIESVQGSSRFCVVSVSACNVFFKQGRSRASGDEMDDPPQANFRVFKIELFFMLAHFLLPFYIYIYGFVDVYRF